MKNRKKIIIISIILFLVLSRIITLLLYYEDFTLIVVNNTDSMVDNIKFKTSGDLEQVENVSISYILPKSFTKVSKRFPRIGETLLATVKNSKNEDFTFPLAYITAPRERIVIKIYIDAVEDGKVQQLTSKTFTIFNTNNLLEDLIPWWIRIYYDYITHNITVV